MFCTPIRICGDGLSTFTPSSGTYFLGRKADQPLDPKAIVDYYGGARTAV
jgi:hypothetical protein